MRLYGAELQHQKETRDTMPWSLCGPPWEVVWSLLEHLTVRRDNRNSEVESEHAHRDICDFRGRLHQAYSILNILISVLGEDKLWKRLIRTSTTHESEIQMSSHKFATGSVRPRMRKILK